MKRHIDLVLNAKGGVGKSFFAVNFVQFLKDRKVEHLAVDTDNANSTLKRFHSETVFVNLNQRQELDTLFTALEKHQLVIVDGRAASTDQFLDYFAEIVLPDLLAQLKASLTLVIPVSHEADSVAQAKVLSEALAGACQYIVVKNEGLTDRFALYEGSQIRKRILGELGGHEIVMPRLYDWLVATLNAESLTATHAVQNGKLSLMDRQRVKSWQQRFYEQIESAKEVLLP